MIDYKQFLIDLKEIEYVTLRNIFNGVADIDHIFDRSLEPSADFTIRWIVYQLRYKTTTEIREIFQGSANMLGIAIAINNNLHSKDQNTRNEGQKQLLLLVQNFTRQLREG